MGLAPKEIAVVADEVPVTSLRDHVVRELGDTPVQILEERPPVGESQSNVGGVGIEYSKYRACAELLSDAVESRCAAQLPGDSVVVPCVVCA